MKKYFFTLAILLLFNRAASATNYFVSTSEGNDANPGTSVNQAWKTLKKVDSMNNSFVAGDSILFKKGDIFYGSITINGRKGTSKDPVVYSAYGVGPMPVLRASQKVGNWQKISNNVWVTALEPLSRLNSNTLVYYRTPSLFINNVAQQIGREPDFNPNDGGFRTISSHTANNQFITEAATLPYPENHFKGAEIAIRTNRDLFNNETVVSHTGNTVVVTATSADASLNTIRDRFGYIFQNHLNTLNREGEWCHDISNRTLYIYSTTDPNTLDIEVPQFPSVLTINNASFVKIQGLGLENASNNILAGQIDDNITIENCQLNNGADYGSSTWRFTNSVFRNNTITNVNDVGFRWEGGNGILISGNSFRNIATRAGMGGEGFIGYTGVRLVSNGEGDPSIIENNTVDSIGYHAVNYLGKNFVVRHNDIQRFCIIKDDGGGIYTVGNKNPNKVYENFVHHAPGARLGAPAGEQVKTIGIYIDNDSRAQEVFNNTVYNLGNWGILANLSGNNYFYDNTLYNCNGTGIALNTYKNTFGENGSTASALNNTMTRNILFPRLPGQNCADFNNSFNPSDLDKLGTLDSNYYCQPFKTGNVIKVQGASTIQYTLDEFRKQYPSYEPNGKPAPVTLEAGDDPAAFIRFEPNPTAQARIIDLGGEIYLDAQGKIYSGKVSIGPYASLALIKGEIVTGVEEAAMPLEVLTVYPNPMVADNDTLTLRLTIARKQKIVVRIYDLSGQLVSQQAKAVEPGEKEIMLNDLKLSSAGTYLLKFNCDGRTFTKRILVTK
ncbi:T9SS type A sorting domain-containing protein [Persicitalea jodogahamensis]|uniref:Uncharacterized protein n=1 Tax=Persicitalea jodogahamensis TaxID=402147 RepID=A0A8J3G944_9BACT|nr:T9SS type A sorting domain-containing protein [Persicitalea jodogahamensis]GHB63617.1 hypothetical protein GCM10007390_16820 [Persicitalea jodogahamensis]